jgi:hypothetical protein
VTRLALLALLIACGRRHDATPTAAPPQRAAPPAPGVVGRAPGPITIDGEWSEPGWNTHALRGVFLADGGAPARPYSEVRLLADADRLLVALYAADQDITSADAFDLRLGALDLHLAATGAVTPPTAGVRAATDRDGTLDQADDRDEEWVVELAIPRAALPRGPLAIDARRCDVTRDAVRRCGAWTGTVALP